VSLAAFIAAQRAEHGVRRAAACRALGMSQAWFYKWRDGDVSLRQARRRALAAQVGYLFTQHKRRYGSPRITADLRELGWRVSKNTVAELMREQHLVARRRRRRSLTKPDTSARKAPDLLQRDFTPPDEPNTRWCGDLTEIRTEVGKSYLASVRDLHSRRCVGFAWMPTTTPNWPGLRCAPRSRSAAARSPG
jgi:putative transposase